VELPKNSDFLIESEERGGKLCNYPATRRYEQRATANSLGEKMQYRLRARFACVAGGLTLAMVCAPATAQNLAISIGVRETQQGGGTSGGPIGSNGASTGGIEFIKLDGTLIPTNGTFQTLTFTFGTDPATAFAGTTANSILEGDWGVLEMIRIRNVDGITQPIRLHIDNIVNMGPAGAPSGTVQDFESFPAGSEVTFQEPIFSGSTSSNVLPGSTSLTTSAIASQGSFSDQIDFQFVDATNTRWVRLTTFNTPNGPNPAIFLGQTSMVQGTTLSFDIRAEIVPEPTSALVGLAGLLLLARRRARE
jgi:hypothetical protein